jgi:ergothioneine biosynthesis protein EgtB
MRGTTLLDAYRRVRARTEHLAAPLSPEDQCLQSMPSASPTKWHRAHTTWFFEEFVLAPRGVARFDPRYAYLFNSYYEAVGPRHARGARGMLSRPSAAEVGDFRRAVDARMEGLLAASDDPAFAALVTLGLAHEEQHQELLLTDIQHALAQSPLQPVYAPEPAVEDFAPKAPAWVEHPGGLVAVGHEGDGFAFDNEGPRHRVWLEPFAIARDLVRVRDVVAFVREGGYRTPSLWLSEGFDQARAQQWTAPLYAEVDGDVLRAFTLHGARALHPDAPATHLSYYEADAIARFLGCRLPTEFEWEAAADEADHGQQLDVGDDGAIGSLAPRPIAPSLYGGVWAWMASSYEAYPGFVAASGAVGEYNGKFMVNQRVLRGGSRYTPRGHVRRTYRNFWHPDTRFQCTGARLARTLR